jgi:hypothetical protein
LQGKLLVIFSLTMFLSIFSSSEVFAEIDYDEIDIQSTSTVYFEISDSKIIVATIQLTNNANVEFSSYGHNFYLVSSGKYFEEISSYDVGVGSSVCPSLEDISAGISREIVLCYEVPKNLPNSSYTVEMMDGYSKQHCDDAKTNQYITNCQIVSKPIKSPVKVNYDEYIKKFILKNNDIKVDFNSIDLIEQVGFNILKINFDVSNLSSNEINYYANSIFAITPDDTSYTSSRWDLTNLGFDSNVCNNYSIDINPKLTKTYDYCFEVPTGINTFDMVIKDGYGDCDGENDDCTEYILNISNPNFVALNQPDPVETTPQETPEVNPPSVSDENKIQELEKQIQELESANKKLQSTIDELQSKLAQSGDSPPKTKKEIASFVDKTKDPQSYVDRYKKESSYKEWFDENYSDYDSIYEAVGKRQPVPDWIKNNAIWWSEGKLSEDEFVGGIEYLVKNKIINVD